MPNEIFSTAVAFCASALSGTTTPATQRSEHMTQMKKLVLIISSFAPLVLLVPTAFPG
jgi:hypothetical protein